MKVGGIIAIVFAVLNLIAGIAILNTEYYAQANEKFVFGIGAFILGIYLINRANQKKKEQKDKDKWNNS